MAALEESNQLMQTEFHSMRLIAEAKNEDLSLLPEFVKSAELSEEEKSLSPDEKIKLGQKFVIDAYYRNSRTRIFDNVAACLDELIEITTTRQSAATKTFSSMYAVLSVAGCVFTLLYLALSVYTYKSFHKK